MGIAGNPVSDPRYFLRQSLGLGIEWGWAYLYGSFIASMPSSVDNASSILAVIWKLAVVAVLSVYLVAPSMRRIFQCRVAAAMAVVFGIAGTILWIVPMGFAGRATITSMFGISYGMFLLFWMWSTRLDSLELCLFYAGQCCIIAGIVFLLVSPLGNGLMFVILSAVLPAIAWMEQGRVMSTRSYRIHDGMPLRQKEYVLKRIDDKLLHVDIRILIGSVCLISLSLGIACQVAARGPMPDAWTYGSIIAGVILCLFSGKASVVSFRLFLFAFLMSTCVCIAMVLPFLSGTTVATVLIRTDSFLMMSCALALGAFLGSSDEALFPKTSCSAFLLYIASLAAGEALWLVWRGESLYLVLLSTVLLAVAANMLLLRDISKRKDQRDETRTAIAADAVDARPIRSKLDAVKETVGLTVREREILEPLSKGYSLESIASAQGTSYNTVKAQVRSIYAKLSIHSRKELFDLANNPAGDANEGCDG